MQTTKRIAETYDFATSFLLFKERFLGDGRAPDLWAWRLSVMVDYSLQGGDTGSATREDLLPFAATRTEPFELTSGDDRKYPSAHHVAFEWMCMMYSASYYLRPLITEATSFGFPPTRDGGPDFPLFQSAIEQAARRPQGRIPDDADLAQRWPIFLERILPSPSFQEEINRLRRGDLPPAPEERPDILEIQGGTGWLEGLANELDHDLQSDLAIEHAKAHLMLQQRQIQEESPQGGTLNEVWSLPMSKVDMRVRLGNLTEKKFKAFAKRHGIKEAGNRQIWQIRLDQMDASTRRRLELP